jgi:hypothetical protein
MIKIEFIQNKLSCGINSENELFYGDDRSGYNTSKSDVNYVCNDFMQNIDRAKEIEVRFNERRVGRIIKLDNSKFSFLTDNKRVNIVYPYLTRTIKAVMKCYNLL